MQAFAFRNQLGQEVALDVCYECQSIWFDKHESQQLAASETLELFRLIHTKGQQQGRAWADRLNCPRCAVHLLPTFDLCKAGKFTYFHCPNQHGRFTAFSAFLVEKGFVRQLTGKEIETLAAEVGSLRCSGCGAAVDIRKDSVCGYCHAPIVVLDPHALEKAIAALEQSASGQHEVNGSAVVDALLLSERQKWLDALQKASAGQLSWRNLDDGPLAQGVDLLWRLFQK
jgi:hypothetical protein